MLDRFIHFTLYVSCIFGAVVAMWLATFCTDEEWPLWLVFATTLLLAVLLLRRLGIPYPLGPS
jgi:hypothetical protein